ncbi:MAG: bifunctional indole-3-glycerol-phosphate synthase TrpC/phosphoribosylanthranilate isomerase TrpF [Ktedonobacteraceae bacterium]|nr:bifunctional indole-3-glycerol-phosphate synthase TrpC/phosphoribosylanthranilate isomerase TrpF [Ktedonobacteraceae bacterium]
MFLNRIVTQTRSDLIERKRECSLEEMRQRASAQTPTRDLLAAFAPRSQVHMIAEVKRASPSKGMLAPDLDPVATALLYEANGAAAISVLTEPHFFLGSPEYLTAIKKAVNLPVLRKDFIVEDYQVYEARAWGADAILLICAILDDTQLRSLLQLAHEYHMHCLVEVHSREEAQRAVEAGARIIGVNSRDLTTFKMNPYLLRELRQIIPADRVVIAESGIHTSADARRLARYDVQGMLVGESLVKSPDIAAQMHMLLHAANSSTQVKICGLRTAEHIRVASEAGADMLGFIFHESSHRYIQPQQIPILLEDAQLSAEQTRPDLVGVFVNKEAGFINDVVEQAGLHFVQLHGTEPPEFCQRIHSPVIKALHINGQEDLQQIKHYKDVAWRLLLDTPTPEWGGTGMTHDWELARQAAQEARILLAGGLTVENVVAAIEQVHPWGIDVSSGVESNKQKDSTKIQAFLAAIRGTVPIT